jgi:Holliday junction resolvase
MRSFRAISISRRSKRKMASNYHRGRALEYEIKHLFEAAGWSVVRGSSSKGKFADMKPDLVASRRMRSNKKYVLMVLAQCKLIGG